MTSLDPTDCPLRVAIAEDSVLLREGLSRLLEEANFQVVAACGSGDELLSELPSLDVDVAILDVRMPPTFTDEGVRTARTIRSQSPQTAVLILSQYVESVYAAELFEGQNGGVGYLLKDRVVCLETLESAVRRVADGGTVLDPEVVQALLTARRDPLETLTPREIDVLELIAQGLTNQEIAAEGHVGLGTVEKQVGSIFAKLGLDAGDGGHRRVLATLTWLRSRGD